MKRSKAWRAADAKIDKERTYTPLEAVRLAKDTSTTSYDATVEVAMRLGVDPRKADQMVRGTVNLPHGTGKVSRVIVFAVGERAAGRELRGGPRRGQPRQALGGQGQVPQEGHGRHHHGSRHPGRREPHPQPARGRQRSRAVAGC